jgi:hypothetical protein
MNSYYRSGEFTLALRLKDALKTEAKFILIVGTAFAGFVVYLMIIGQMTLINIPEIFVLLSNLWGLLLVMVLLGFGLVIIPVNLWKKGDLKRSLEIVQVKVVNLEGKRKEILEGIERIRRQVERIKDCCEFDEVLRKSAFCVWEELKDELQGVEGESRESKGSERDEEGFKTDYKELVRVHKKVKNLVFEKKRNEW